MSLQPESRACFIQWEDLRTSSPGDSISRSPGKLLRGGGGRSQPSLVRKLDPTWSGNQNPHATAKNLHPATKRSHTPQLRSKLPNGTTKTCRSEINKNLKLNKGKRLSRAVNFTKSSYLLGKSFPMSHLKRSWYCLSSCFLLVQSKIRFTVHTPPLSPYSWRTSMCGFMSSEQEACPEPAVVKVKRKKKVERQRE